MSPPQSANAGGRSARAASSDEPSASAIWRRECSVADTTAARSVGGKSPSGARAHGTLRLSSVTGTPSTRGLVSSATRPLRVRRDREHHERSWRMVAAGCTRAAAQECPCSVLRPLPTVDAGTSTSSRARRKALKAGSACTFLSAVERRSLRIVRRQVGHDDVSTSRYRARRCCRRSSREGA